MNAIESIVITAQKVCQEGSNSLRTATPVPSPCVSVCKMDASRTLCTGCLRTIAEITAWSRIDDLAKLAVWALIEGRAQASVQSSFAVPVPVPAVSS